MRGPVDLHISTNRSPKNRLSALTDLSDGLLSEMAGLFSGTPLERPVTCAHCGLSVDDCACPRNCDGEIVLPRDQPVRVHRERRRGKWTTVVRGLNPDATDMPALLKQLRSSLAAGGSITGQRDEPQIEIQGDHRDRVVCMMQERGYPAKAAGG